MMVKTKSNDVIMQNKAFAWVLIATGIILFIPLIAMQFTSEVNWTLSDFVVMGTLLFIMGSTFIVGSRKFPKNRVLVGILVAILLMYVWAELAVGIFTKLGN